MQGIRTECTMLRHFELERKSLLVRTSPASIRLLQKCDDRYIAQLLSALEEGNFHNE